MTDDRLMELDELLLTRATEGLSASEDQRLKELLGADASADSEWVDRVVGELDAMWADTQGSDPLAPALADRIIADARSGQGAKPKLELVQGDAKQTSAPVAKSSRTRAGAWMGWAAAAALALAWLGVGRGGGPEQQPTFVDLAARDGALVRPWTATEDPAALGATGEVVWDATGQEGIMRFSGLEANDPTEFQYQLWIFDETRDERYPVDGGVFDVGPDGETMVPIRAKLNVEQPTLFAVTVEEPGGVVVSSRERIVLVAQVAAAE